MPKSFDAITGTCFWYGKKNIPRYYIYFFLPETSACGRNAVFHYAFHIKPQFSKKNRSYI